MQPLVTARAVDRSFDYVVPAELIGELRRGSLVQVEFGARSVTAVVAEVTDGSDDDLKPIEAVQGQLAPALVDLAEWIAAECGSTTARALALVHPAEAGQACAQAGSRSRRRKHR